MMPQGQHLLFPAHSLAVRIPTCNWSNSSTNLKIIRCDEAIRLAEPQISRLSGSDIIGSDATRFPLTSAMASMLPPAYTDNQYFPKEKESLDWTELGQYITAETRTPRLYYALQVVVVQYTRYYVRHKHFLRTFGELEPSSYEDNLWWGRNCWIILHLFSESMLFLVTEWYLIQSRSLEAFKFGYVCRRRKLLLASGIRHV